MQYRVLGSTGLSVSLLGIGALHLNELPQQDVTKQLLDKALSEGVNYIDTAQCYGASEKMLGRALQGMRDRFYLSTKSLRREPRGLRNDFQNSLEHLGTDHVDLYFLHDISEEATYQTVLANGCYELLKELQDQGKIGHICVSTHHAALAVKMIEAGLFAAIMLGYNLADCETAAAIKLAQERNVGVVIMKPYAGGVLGRHAGDYGLRITPRDALRFVLSNPDIATVIPGFDRMEYLEEALAVVNGDYAMGGEEAAALIEAAGALSSHYCRGCGYCQPCPEGIPVTPIMQLYSRYLLFKGRDWSQMHQIDRGLREYQEELGKCKDCGVCRERCPYKLPVAESIRELYLR